MNRSTLIDGRVADDELARDRGLHYGDGVFETIAWRDGAPRFFERHVKRLARGCAALGIRCPDEASLRTDLETLDPGDGPCVVKLVVTRGDGGAGYRPDEAASPRRLWQVRAWPSLDASCYARGVDVAWLDSRLSRNRALAGVKHLGRVEQVLAARELATHDTYEGLVRDRGGLVIEAVSANVFVVQGDRLLTPRLDEAGVAGVMREAVIDAARELGVDVEEACLRRADFARADEVFLTNAVRGIVPVRSLGRLSLGVGELAKRISVSMASHGVSECG